MKIFVFMFNDWKIKALQYFSTYNNQYTIHLHKGNTLLSLTEEPTIVYLFMNRQTQLRHIKSGGLQINSSMISQ